MNEVRVKIEQRNMVAGHEACVERAEFLGASPSNLIALDLPKSAQACDDAFEDPRRCSRIAPFGALGASHVVVVDHAACHRRGAEPLVLEDDGQRGENTAHIEVKGSHRTFRRYKLQQRQHRGNRDRVDNM